VLQKQPSQLALRLEARKPSSNILTLTHAPHTATHRHWLRGFLYTILLGRWPTSGRANGAGLFQGCPPFLACGGVCHYSCHTTGSGKQVESVED
jgi:hypothetical protein